MSTEEEITVVSDVENAKKSDGTSTAGEHNMDKVIDEQSTVEKEDEIKSENDKREIDTDLTTTTNTKTKVIETLTDETDSEKPNEELIIV